MSLTLELLRMETDREPMYWPFNASSTGLISAVPHDCPKAIKKATTNTTADPGALVNNNNNNNNNASTKNSVLNGLSQHKRHSYYECCVNVEVSALLEHWLGWDDKNHHCSSNIGDSPALHSEIETSNSMTNHSVMTPNTKSSLTGLGVPSWADRLVSHLVTGSNPTDDQQNEDPSIWVRKFCSEVGCDVLKKQDTNGKTLLHHLLSGAVKRNLASTAMILLEAGTPSYLADSNGDTPLHLIRNLMSQESHVAMDEVCELVRVLLEKSANPEKLIDLPDVKGRSLLSYAVEAGDRCAALSRLLINLGAKTFSEKLDHTSSSFAWFLRAQMRKLGSEVSLDEDTFYILSTAMIEEVGGHGQGLKFKSILDRSMVAMGSSPEAHGPLFRRIRGLAAAYWLQPPQLRLLATTSIRRSLGPKRLSKEVMSRLKVPRKLQRFVTLEEKIPNS